MKGTEKQKANFERTLELRKHIVNSVSLYEHDILEKSIRIKDLKTSSLDGRIVLSFNFSFRERDWERSLEHKNKTGILKTFYKNTKGKWTKEKGFEFN